MDISLGHLDLSNRRKKKCIFETKPLWMNGLEDFTTDLDVPKAFSFGEELIDVVRSLLNP